MFCAVEIADSIYPFAELPGWIGRRHRLCGVDGAFHLEGDGLSGDDPLLVGGVVLRLTNPSYGLRRRRDFL